MIPPAARIRAACDELAELTVVHDMRPEYVRTRAQKHVAEIRAALENLEMERGYAAEVLAKYNLTLDALTGTQQHLERTLARLAALQPLAEACLLARKTFEVMSNASPVYVDQQDDAHNAERALVDLVLFGDWYAAARAGAGK